MKKEKDKEDANYILVTKIKMITVLYFEIS